MLEIDGSMGEGGGQILRTALTLSLVLQRPFRLTNIRRNRDKPGLQRQHLAAVKAAAAISRAEVGGAELGAGELCFIPQQIVAGTYSFDIGSAGSTTLLLQAILLPLIMAGAPSRLHLVGGTHNPMAPTFEFLQQAYLPLLARMGGDVTIELLRPGFYPCGGGELSVGIRPVTRLKPLHLLERGDIRQVNAVALLARLPEHIAVRELNVVKQGLGVSPQALNIEVTDRAYCPGNALQVRVESEACMEVFSAIGQRGVPAEVVAQGVVEQVRRYLAAGVTVGQHLADQLLLPLALAGEGRFMTLEPDRHTPTNIEVIRRFLPVSFTCSELGPDRWRIDVIRQEEGER